MNWNDLIALVLKYLAGGVLLGSIFYLVASKAGVDATTYANYVYNVVALLLGHVVTKASQ